MAKQTIGIGAAANDGTGDDLRVAFDKVNDNFSEIYTELGGTTLSNLNFIGNTISSEDSNGAIILDPNGTGNVTIASGSLVGNVTGALTGNADTATTAATVTTAAQPTITSVGTLSSLNIGADRYNISTTYTPASSVGSPGDTTGDVAVDNSFFYYCTGVYDGSTVIWVRSTLSAF